MIDPLTLNPTTQEDTQAGDRISMDEERAQTLWERQKATQVVVGTVSGYIRSVVESAQAKLANTSDPESQEALRRSLGTYTHLARVHGHGAVRSSKDPVQGTRIASRKITAAEVLDAPDLPVGTRESLEARRLDMDHLIDEAIEQTWVKEGRLLSQRELEARALELALERPESKVDPSNPRITLESYIQNFVRKG